MSTTKPYKLKRREGTKNRDVYVGGVRAGWVRRVDHNRAGGLSRGQRNGWVAMAGDADLYEDQGGSSWPPYPLVPIGRGQGDVYDTLREAAMAVYRYMTEEK